MHSSSRSHNISNQLHFSNTKEKKILSGPHWKFNDVHNHLIMRKQVQVIIQVIMFQQLITSNICDNCKHRLITLLCFSHLKARFNTYIFILEHGCYRCTFLSSNRMYWDFALNSNMITLLLKTPVFYLSEEEHPSSRFEFLVSPILVHSWPLLDFSVNSWVWSWFCCGVAQKAVLHSSLVFSSSQHRKLFQISKGWEEDLVLRNTQWYKSEVKVHKFKTMTVENPWQNYALGASSPIPGSTQTSCKWLGKEGDFSKCLVHMQLSCITPAWAQELDVLSQNVLLMQLHRECIKHSDNGMILNVFSWLVLLRDTKERKKKFWEFEKEALLCKTFAIRAVLIGVTSSAFPDEYSLLGCHQMKYSLISHEIQPLKVLTWADGGPVKMLKLSQSVSLNFCSGINCCCVRKEMSYLSAMQFNVLRMLWCFACHV